MIEVFESAALIAIGISAFGLAPHISNWEKQLSDSCPWTRVTGWSGTQKGILAWRVIGAVLAILGLINLLLVASIR